MVFKNEFETLKELLKEYEAKKNIKELSEEDLNDPNIINAILAVHHTLNEHYKAVKISEEDVNAIEQLRDKIGLLNVELAKIKLDRDVYEGLAYNLEKELEEIPTWIRRFFRK